jgi:hypothetical protein
MITSEIHLEVCNALVAANAKIDHQDELIAVLNTLVESQKKLITELRLLARMS